jgi:hypothetical protein
MDFVDVTGASGASYRFRRWPGMGLHPPVAGNYLVLDLATRQPIAIGVMDNLADARERVGVLPRNAELFTRLNVARAHRESEHADVAARNPDAAERRTDAA